MKIHKDADKIILECSYDERDFPKSLGAKWNQINHNWEIPLTLFSSITLWDKDLIIDEILSDFIKNYNKDCDTAPPKLKLPLFSYQVKAYQQALANKKFGLFADMGTGKTIMALALAQKIYEDNEICNTLIVCPLSIISVWKEQIDKFIAVPYNIIEIFGTKKQRLEELKRFERAKGLNFGIINYEGLLTLHEELLDMHWTFVCCDESSRIKNRNAKCTQIAIELADQSEYALALTGTPISNTVDDIFSQARFISPNIFGESYWRFADRYCIFGGYEQKQIVAAKNQDELKEIMNKFSFRITKEEAIDLPPKTYEIRRVPLGDKQSEVYEQAEKEFEIACQAVKEDTGEIVNKKVLINNALVQLLRCQQIASGYVKTNDDSIVTFTDNYKINELINIIQDSYPQKIVVFSRFLDDLKNIKNELNNKSIEADIFSGEVKQKDREQILNDFKKDLRVLLCQVQTGGFGIDLSVANIVVFYNNWWSFGVREQAESRTHRIGQTKNCLYIDLIAEGTVDEHIYKAIKKKKGISEYLFGVKEGKELE